MNCLLDPIDPSCADQSHSKVMYSDSSCSDPDPVDMVTIESSAPSHDVIDSSGSCRGESDVDCDDVSESCKGTDVATPLVSAPSHDVIDSSGSRLLHTSTKKRSVQHTVVRGGGHRHGCLPKRSKPYLSAGLPTNIDVVGIGRNESVDSYTDEDDVMSMLSSSSHQFVGARSGVLADLGVNVKGTYSQNGELCFTL